MIIKSEKVMKRKGQFLFIVFILGFIFLIGKLTYIVMVEGKNYDLAVLQNAAKKEGSVTLNDKRGRIIDRNGIVLADSISTYGLIFDAKLLASLDEDIQNNTKQFLYETLGISTDKIDEILATERNNNYKIIGNGYSYSEFKEVKEKIDNYQVKGIFYLEDYERKYNYPELASDIIGFVNNEFVGSNGIEAYYDNYLSGTIGRIYGTINEDKMMEVQEVEAVDGADVMLTLDFTIQRYVNEAIDNYLAEYEATKLHVIVMDPNNGEILGMANWPDYSLDNPRDVISYVSDEEYAQMTEKDRVDFLYGMWKNENVTDGFEPGSTFKPFVYATALEENKVSINTIYTCYGQKQVADYSISCWKPEGHGEQTLLEGLQNSCNVMFMEVGESIGRHTFHQYQTLFGFGALTGIDIEGEESLRGQLHTEAGLNPVELATNSFGQTFEVTPIQLISGFSSLINGGHLYEPHLMKKIYTDNQIIISDNVQKLRQVISEEVSKMTREALGGVVNEGTGKKAKIAGYEIGGKTGTAEKDDRDDVHYIVSFIGFAPIENPEIVTLVVVDEPVSKPAGERINSKYAASIFVDVMEDVMPYLRIFKDELEDESDVSDESE